jgi:transcriptional regulator with XRE-family HTH domain
MSDTKTIGGDIRALRKSRKMTLEDLAKGTQKSLGWISQVERGLSAPTVSDLHDIARVLEVSISLFFGEADAPEGEKGHVVRASARRELGHRDNGLVEELLSPDLTDDFEVLHSKFLPHSALKKSRARATTEVVYLISGVLDIWIEDQCFTIQAGDSFRIKGAQYRWANPYNDPANAVWVISPPVY